jgi:hypothetical protein
MLEIPTSPMVSPLHLLGTFCASYTDTEIKEEAIAPSKQLRGATSYDLAVEKAVTSESAVSTRFWWSKNGHPFLA